MYGLRSKNIVLNTVKGQIGAIEFKGGNKVIIRTSEKS